MKVLGIVFALLISALALSDEIRFANGDRLSGEFIRMENGDVFFETALFGVAKLPWEDVSSLEVESPVLVVTEDTEFFGRVITSGSGGLELLVNGNPHRIPWAAITAINPSAPKPGPAPRWKGVLSSNLGISRSNRDAQNFNLNLELERDGVQDRVAIDAAYDTARQSDSLGGSLKTTRDSWFAQGQYDYMVSEKFFWYGELRFDRDRIASLDLRTVVGAGGGYTFFDTETDKLRASVGVSYLTEDFSGAGDSEYVAATFGTLYRKRLTKGIRLAHDFSYYPNPDDLADYFLSSELALRSALSETLFAEFKFVFDYDATPAPGSRSENYRYTMGIGLRF